ncbi:MAG: EVE domain-containing protein [Zetaproteobacteria bacterium]|nr:EVE domain-containing protein [Pseudobdellovibrionaceae bacterium]|tara:strand:+ start:223 stop:687 length:465 start_codon:yes stop_codon:yes gene_type:complete
MNYWLLKSEPNVFSIDDLKKQPQKTDHWDGVRNYQARNFMKEMKKGDLAFFYHSNCDEPGIVGLMTVTKEAYPDHTAWDKKSQYYDPKSTKETPRWYMVNVTYKKTFSRNISLKELKLKKDLEDLPLIRKGNRLSIMPVSKKSWESILSLVKKN